MTQRRIYQCAFPILFSFTFMFFWVPAVFAKGVNPEEKVYYYLQDHLGGVDAVLNEDGDVIQRKDYLPFGSERLAMGSSDEDYGFTGKELDEETGLYYYGARYYDPEIGRFVSLDPLVLGESSKSFSSVLANPQALNGYSYVLNNPLRYVDEEGAYQKDVHYDLTYVLGLVSGLSENISRIIAYNDQNTDDNPATSPGNYNGIEGRILGAKSYKEGVTNEYHFQTKAEALSRLKAATNNNDAVSFGTALHTFQDTFSHGQFGTDKKAPLRHLAQGQSPDKTYNDIELANSMARETFYQLRNFKLASSNLDGDEIGDYYDETADLWNKISGTINDYNSSINKSNTSIFSVASGSKTSISSNEKDDDKKDE